MVVNMKIHNMARISQCMIVKNEERKIEQALSWGKGVVSEQIVVDTGSTDRTVEIAERMGAQVYHFEWIDDFAAAKNYAISKAKYEWIAFLDADEYFTPEDARKLLYYVRKLQNRKYDIILTGWIHLDNNGEVMGVGTQARIFRNDPGLGYKRRIHEGLGSLGDKAYTLVDATNELSIYHTGYGKIENKEKTASKRNLKLILLELEEHPEDWEMLGYLGDEYYSRGDLDQAEKAFRDSIARIPEDADTVYDPIRIEMDFVKLLELLYSKRNVEEPVFLEVYEQAVKWLPEDGDTDYLAGKYYVERGDCKKGETYLKKALEKLEKYGTSSKAMLLAGSVQSAYELLAGCCYNNGKLGDCISNTIILLKMDRYLMGPLFLMLSAFRQDEANGREGAADAAAVAAFLGQSLYDFTSLKDRLFVLKAAMKAYYEGLTGIIRGMFTPEELQLVDQALSREEQEG